jgi:colanic acid/amylovoran biosynthesis protein
MGAWLLGHSAEVFARFWLTPDQYAALREFCEADAVISTGGTYMVERYDIQGRLLELEAAVLMKRPLILFTQSLGPFSKPGNRRAIRRVANRARLVLLRDETSRRHLTEIGVAGPHLHVVPDGVFAFPLHAPAATDQVKHIAISVRDWPYADDAVRANTAYRNAIGGLATHLIHDRGVHITFLSTCQGTPNYWTDDSAVAVRIAEDLGPDVRDSVTVDQTFHTPEELVARLADFDLVIATRMHMAILSLVAGVPVFPIAYEFKTQELFEHLGLGVWVRDFDAVASPGFAADVDRFIDTLPEITNGLWSAVRAEHASAVNTVGLIRTALAAAE